MPVKIVTDSAADLTPEQARDNDVTVVPLTIRFGDDEYVDGVDLDAQGFYDKMAATDVLPATAAPSPGAFEQAFRDAGANGDPVVCINLSSALSATMQSAQTAERGIGGGHNHPVMADRTITGDQGLAVPPTAKAAR